jgi:hypothetical protein
MSEPEQPQRYQRENGDPDRLVQVIKLELLNARKVAHRPSQREHDEDQRRNQPMQCLCDRCVILRRHGRIYHLPVFGIEAHGS